MKCSGLKMISKDSFFVLGILVITLVGFVSGESIGTVCIDKSPPSSPTNLEVSGSVGNLLIKWDASIDSPSCSGIAEYIILRNGIEIGKVNGDVLSFVDNSSLGQGSYNYTVFAVDIIGKNAGSSIKNEVSVSGGGKVSGGSPHSSFECIPDWSCGNWSECLNGNQMRICTDLDDCGTVYLKPETSRECDDESEILEEGMEVKNNKDFFSTITGAVAGVMSSRYAAPSAIFIILVISGLIVIRTVKKNKPKKSK